MNSLDNLVPADHLVRKLDEFIDWSFINTLTDPLYSNTGRGRIDPVILFKMIFINKLFGINSMRKTCEEIKVNLAYRWFLGLSFEVQVTNHSTYSKNYRRKFKDNQISEQFFMGVLGQLHEQELIDMENLFIDGTHTKANANNNKYNKEELDMEINEDRIKHGKKKYKRKRRRTSRKGRKSK